MQNKFPEQVFVSYSRKDIETMQKIVEFLRNQGIKVWLDNESLVIGTRTWEKEIENAISNSMAILVLLSPDSKRSEWVRREITYSEQYSKTIIPILVRGDTTESIPISLINYQFLDLRVGFETGLDRLRSRLLKRKEELEKLRRRVTEGLSTKGEDVDVNDVLLAFDAFPNRKAGMGNSVNSNRESDLSEEQIESIHSLQETLRSSPNLPTLPIMTFLEAYSGVNELGSENILKLLLLEYRKWFLENIEFRKAFGDQVPDELETIVKLLDRILLDRILFEKLRPENSPEQGGTTVDSNLTGPNVTTNMIANLGRNDLETLAHELSQIRGILHGQSLKPEQDVDVGQIAAAEIAARNGDRHLALLHLENVGTWALDFATQAGASLTAHLMKKWASRS